MATVLSPELDRLIQQKVTTGGYASAEEVVREALRLLDEREAETPEWKADVRAKIEEAWLSLERGEGIDGETAVAELRRRHEEKRRQMAG